MKSHKDILNSPISEDSLFLKKKDHQGLYRVALAKALHDEQKPEEKSAVKKFPEPVEQLSPAGIALNLYIQSKKDKSNVYPLLADSIDALYETIDSLLISPFNSKITIILQPTHLGRETKDDFEDNYSLSESHKSVLHIERTSEGLRVIHVDSLVGYGDTKLRAIFRDRILKKMKDDDFLLEWFQEDPKHKDRQKDEYQCGIFAMKDAIQVSRDASFSEKIKKSSELMQENDERSKLRIKVYSYTLPPEYLKSLQSEKEGKAVLQAHGDEIVTRKKESLGGVFKKHEKKPGGYVHYFSEKYQKNLIKFFKENESSDLKAMVLSRIATKENLKKLIPDFKDTPLPYIFVLKGSGDCLISLLPLATKEEAEVKCQQFFSEYEKYGYSKEVIQLYMPQEDFISKYCKDARLIEKALVFVFKEVFQKFSAENAAYKSKIDEEQQNQILIKRLT